LFLLIGPQQQLAKLHDYSFNTARNLGFIFDEHLSLINFLLCLNLAILIFVNFVVSVCTLISKQPVPLPPHCPLRA